MCPLNRLASLLLMFLITVPAFAQERLKPAGRAKLISIAPGWAGNTVNVVIFRKNSLTTLGDTQFAAFYDQQGRVVLAKRKLESDVWDIRTTQYTGNVRDAHNDICIAVDGKGILHVAWDHHANALRYARGVAPGSLELTEKMPMTGQRENRVTYPEFYNLAGGDLLFAYRDGASGNGNLVLNRYDVASEKWEQVQQNLIDGQNERNAYTQAAVDETGVIHVSWVWRESGDVATNHDLCYARSSDGGKTWQKSTGEPYSIPITMASAEVAVKIPQKQELINQTSMTTDSKGHPYIATYWREADADIPQYHVVYHDGSDWHVSQVGQQTIAFRLGGAGTKRIPISRPQILADSGGGVDKAYLLFRDEGRGNKVSLAICDDLSKGSWKIEDLTASSVLQWEPSYDLSRWRRDKVIDVFVQAADQRDGEGVANVPAEMVYVLEWKPG
jgi:hypothetical protein